MNAPKAKKIEKILEIHGDQRIDNYFWMNERENPEVTQYLEEENAYCDFVMKDTENFQQELFDEMKSRYKEDDQSLPYFFNEYWYIVRFEIGKEYPIFSRKFQTLEQEEEILLDVNISAEGQKFFEVGSVAVSPNNKLMTFSTDNMGRRIYNIQFKNLETGEILQDQIANTTGKAVWANDNEHIFYIRKDKKSSGFSSFYASTRDGFFARCFGFS
jgi:Protease II